MPCAQDPDSRDGYLSSCSRCFHLAGHRTHAHICQHPDAYLATRPDLADHTWPTSQPMRPVFHGGRHVGYRCAGTEPCGYIEYLDRSA